MKYTICKQINEGAYGKVYVIEDEKNNKYALKECMHKNVIFGLGNLKELDILSKLSKCIFFPKLIDIIKSYKFSTDNTIIKTSCISFVTELAEYDGVVFFKDKALCTPDVALDLTYQFLIGLDYMHSRKITHRDIKPGNILITTLPNGKYRLKICDFGISQFLCDNSMSTPGVFTIWYRPPEVCWEIKKYGQVSDMFSAGLVIYEMFTNNILMSGSSQVDKNSLIFRDLIERLPVKLTNNMLNIYKIKCGVEIRFDMKNACTDTFMDRFSKNTNYNILPEIKWNQLSDLLTNILSYDFRERYSSSKCLTLDLFDDHFVEIESFKDDKSSDKALDIIKIVKNDRLKEIKKKIFKLFFKNIESIGIRTFFHALDLTNNYFNHNQECTDENAEKIIRCSLYFFNKYFSSINAPFFPQCFFMDTKEFNEMEEEKKQPYLRNLNKYIYDFDVYVIEKLSSKYSIYRPTLFEMPDDYYQSLTNGQLMEMFDYFLNIDEFNNYSYRYMYRIFYGEFIDVNFFKNK